MRIWLTFWWLFLLPAGLESADFPLPAPDEDSLRAAIAAARENSGPNRILLPSGTIRLAETLVLTKKDAGLTLESADPTQPCWVSGSTLLGREAWKPVSGSKTLWAAILPAAWPEPRSLFWEGKSLPRARSRAFSQLARPPDAVPYRDRRPIDTRRLYAPAEVFEAIPDFAGGAMRVIPRYPWTMHLLPIARVNREFGWLESDVPGTYAMTPPGDIVIEAGGGSLWIENVAAALDEPGEWRFDPATREVILWPPDGKAPGDRVGVPRLTELLRIEGEIDEASLEDRPVRGVALRGIGFTGANAHAWETGKTGWGLQHDWEMYDRPTAMVRLRGAEDCRIERCRFENAGAAGVRLDLHCRGNTVSSSRFSDLGGAGILLAGYGMGYKDVNRDNKIADNTIQHIGQVWWHSPAIFLWQSGHNRIVHNRIAHTPYTGIVVSTRTQLSVSGDKESSKTVRWDEAMFHLESRDRSWPSREPLMHGRQNEIAGNDIHHVLEKLGDGNAIYVSGTGGGNRVAGNFVHDIHSPNLNAAIRCDDDQHEVAIERNVIARVCGEGLIWKGRCDILNNVVFNPLPKTPAGVRVGHQRGFLVLSGDPVTGSTVRHNVFVSVNPRAPILYEHAEPWKRGARTMPPVRLADCDADENLYWCAGNPQWAEDFLATQRARGIEKGSVFADPRFRDPKANDFTFGPESPAARLGIAPVDVSRAGPRE
ncbi:MAG: right-handed parallel beta-helix repeat-containing protein [Akkermansiaceae bacterium]|nr:right-handed parallel beta-helix repeat-containing protein [Akkermansiaceae bacterium]